MKWIMAMGAVLAIPALAYGAASFTLTAGGSGTAGATAVTVDPGDSFGIDLGIVQGDANGTAGFGGALQASANDQFYITGRSWHIAYADANTTDTTLLNDTNKWLVDDAHPGQNIGAINDETGYWPAGDFPQVVETFTIQTNSDPGVYTITIGDAGGGILISDGLGEDEQTPLTIGSYQVTITPEPASMLLLAGALPFLRRRRSA